MKKIKLFALAAFAMLSLNVMAQEEATDTYTYTLAGTDATITGFVNGLTDAQMATVTIPAKIGDNNVVAVDGEAGLSTKFKGNTKIKKVVIETNDKFVAIDDESFEGCSSMTEIDLSKVKNLEYLGDYALAGTSITTLDLSKTKVRTLNMFNNVGFHGNADPAKAALGENKTLTTVVLCDTWETINNNAFAWCTALKSVNFQTANPTWIEFAGKVPGDQTIGVGAFMGTAIEDLDFSGTLVDNLTNLIFKNAVDDEYPALKTVKLNADINDLGGNFRNCPNLTSIDIENSAVVALNDYEFQFDAKLTSINLKNITTLAEYAFNGSGLTSVSFNKNIPAIPAYCFQDCSSLAKVEFASDYATFHGIETMAFAGDTKLTEIIIPKVLDDADDAIDVNAFFMCTGLKSVTYKPDAAPANEVFNIGAFTKCNDKAPANLITIYTTLEAAAALTTPTCTKFDGGDAPAADIDGVIFDVKEYASVAGKYYVKVQTPVNTWIQVKAVAGTKVYEAYLDAVKETLNMIPYMVNGGYYKIGNATAKQQALIITDNADIAYEENAGATSTSPLSMIAGYNNAMEILDAATSVTTLAAAAGEKLIYGWANSATKGTGWLNITSGTMAKGSLYVLAKKPADGARLNVVWLDENGNVDEEITAIQNVKAAKAENGAIYNLAGQKVNAAYKGVVIKDGKKYIQK